MFDERVEKVAGGFFTRRLDEWQPIIGLLGKRPPVEDALQAADGRVVAKAQELVDACGGFWTSDELQELGSRWADGKVKAKTVADRISSAATRGDTGRESRVESVLRGALPVLRSNEESDGLSKGRVAEEVAGLVRGRLKEECDELVAAWNELPDRFKDHARRDDGDRPLEGVVDLLDVAVDAPEDVAAVQRVARCARRIGSTAFSWPNGPECLIHAGVDTAWKLSGRRNEDQYDYRGDLKPNGVTIDDTVLWFAASTEEPWFGAPQDLIADGVTEFSVILDPLGADREEYERRLALKKSIDEFKNEYFELKRFLIDDVGMKAKALSYDWGKLERRTHLRGQALIDAWREWVDAGKPEALSKPRRNRRGARVA